MIGQDVCSELVRQDHLIIARIITRCNVAKSRVS